MTSRTPNRSQKRLENPEKPLFSTVYQPFSTCANRCRSMQKLAGKRGSDILWLGVEPFPKSSRPRYTQSRLAVDKAVRLFGSGISFSLHALVLALRDVLFSHLDYRFTQPGRSCCSSSNFVARFTDASYSSGFAPASHFLHGPKSVYGDLSNRQSFSASRGSPASVRIFVNWSASFFRVTS